MSDVTIARPMRIAEAGYDEHWLRDRIFEEPSILGLGDLQALTKEKPQSTGGRLDLLLKNPVDDAMFEVELQLGKTDETHIIRTLEYWDAEKRRWPKRSHTAVLVAEEITSRFFNVVQLLSQAIPIIGIQANLITIGDLKALNFVKIIDTYEEPGIEDEFTVITEQSWRDSTPHVVECAKWYRDMIGMHYDDVTIKYLSNDIVLHFGEYNRVWIHPRKGDRVYIRVSTEEQQFVIDELSKRNIAHSPVKDWGVGFNIDLEQLNKFRDKHDWLAKHIASSWLKTSSQ